MSYIKEAKKQKKSKRLASMKKRNTSSTHQGRLLLGIPKAKNRGQRSKKKNGPQETRERTGRAK